MSSDIIKRPVKTLRVTTQKQDCNKCLAVIWTKNFAFVITNLLDTPCPKPPQYLKFNFIDNLSVHSPPQCIKTRERKGGAMPSTAANVILQNVVLTVVLYLYDYALPCLLPSYYN